MIQALFPLGLKAVEDAARSLEEGLAETLSLHRLNVFAELGFGFRTTNLNEGSVAPKSLLYNALRCVHPAVRPFSTRNTLQHNDLRTHGRRMLIIGKRTSHLEDSASTCLPAHRTAARLTLHAPCSKADSRRLAKSAMHVVSKTTYMATGVPPISGPITT
jgi:hypothetical protein